MTNKRIADVVLLAAILAAGCVAGRSQVHTVQAGDTLAQIAQANGTAVEAIVDLNKDTYPSLATNPNAIEVGWELELPGSQRAIRITSKKSPSLGTGPTATVALDRDTFEVEVVRLVNAERAQSDLALLERDPALMTFARQRSEDMVARGYFSHTDPETGQDLTPGMGENISRYSSRWIGEDLARSLVRGLMNSEGHRSNILHAHARRIGVGVAIGDGQIVITQVFAR